MSVSEELARLMELRERGVLTEDEFQRQKAAVLAGQGTGPAPLPAGPKPKSGGGAAAKGCLILLAIVLVLGVIGALLGDPKKDGGAGSGEQATAAAPPVEVTATELYNAYQANEAAAQKRYGSTPLLVSGKVEKVELGLGDDPFISLVTPNEFMSAQARLTDTSKAKAADISRGADIKLLCGGVSEIVGTPMLSDCEIQ